MSYVCGLSVVVTLHMCKSSLSVPGCELSIRLLAIPLFEILFFFVCQDKGLL